MHINAYLSQLGYSSLYSNSLTFSKRRKQKIMVVARFALLKGSVRHLIGTLQTIPPDVIKISYHRSYVFAFWAIHTQIQTEILNDAHLLCAPSSYPVHLTACINIQQLYEINSYPCQQLLPLFSKHTSKHDMLVTCSALLETSTSHIYMNTRS